MLDDSFGPFSVAPSQIARLGGDFTPFINELLRVEAAAAGVDGGRLATTYLENIGDRGVDACLDSQVPTRYLPAGKSGWQFKAGNPSPSKCASELRSAEAALEILREGGTYRLLVGADINADAKRRRRVALETAAADLGINVEPGTIEVLNASDLAEWASEHPSLAVSPLLGGVGHVALNFASWSVSTGMTETWVSTAAAELVASAVDGLLASDESVGLHVEGVSGLGKTRSVLEALRGKGLEALVAYVHAADALPASLVYHLHLQKRRTILVVDECDAGTSDVLVKQIPVGSKVRLITIGTPTGYRPRSEVIKAAAVDDQAMRDILRLNQPALPAETARFVIEAAAGNVKLALLLANDIVQRPTSTAADLITTEIIRSYVTKALPSGSALLPSAALALFTNVGFDEDRAGEIRTLALALRLDVMDLKAAAADLAQAGLISRQGRFRAVSPHPLAIYLAARAWEEFGDAIVSSLLPALETSMAERLLQRAADIGDYAPTRTAVARLLAPGGLYAGIGLHTSDNNGRLTQHLAVLAPRVMADRLSAALGVLTDDERALVAARRQDIVWTLEKLAWHSATFRRAADSLLLLAIATEGRDFEMRARSWTDLFGAMLPSTSASPSSRIEYLRDASLSEDARIRALAVRGAKRASSGHESVMSSAEVQGGFLVARRGTPATYGEVWDYVEAAIDILAELGNDSDSDIAAAATSALISVIHPLLVNDRLRDRVATALARLPSSGLTRALTEIEHLGALFARREADTESRRAGLEALIAALPGPSPMQAFAALANARRWDFDDANELQRRLDTAALALPEAERVSIILDLVATAPQASFELGRTLYGLSAGADEILDRLVEYAAANNIASLDGFLWASVDGGRPESFDELLDGKAFPPLDAQTRLAISVRGPQSEAGWRRVETLVGLLPPRDGAVGLFGWHVDFATDRLQRILDDWLGRLNDQNDYNAVVDFVAMALFKSSPWVDTVDPLVAQLVARRHDFPDIRNEEYDWVRLARRQLRHAPAELHETLLSLIENDALYAFNDSEEEGLLREAIRLSGPDGWRKTMERLSGTYRLQWVARGWLANAVDLDDLKEWVGNDLERARLVASIATAGRSESDPVARFLLVTFPDDDISSSLGSEYTSGGYSGSVSSRCQEQITQLTGWIDSTTEPQAAKDWAQSMINTLEIQRDSALQQEAERDW